MFQGLIIIVTLLVGAAAAASMRGFVVHEVERQERIPWTTTRHAVLARETVARCLFLLLAPIGWREPRPARTVVGVPVILVPDPTVGRGAMLLLGAFLRQRGVDTWAIGFSGDDPTLAERAEELERRVELWRVASGSEQVDLVAFGTGGLVAAWYLHHGEGHRRVRRLVTLGTPWRGTRMAVFFDGRLALEARPDSHHLDGLLPPAVPTLSVWCPEDPEVVPATSARADDVRSVAVEGAGHLGLLLSARTWRAVLTGLRERLPETA